MKVVCLKYFQHISRIIEIIQPNIKQQQNDKNQIQKVKNIDLQLQKELEYLKNNIENLLRYTQSLQNQNKQMRMKLKTTEIYERNSYKINQNSTFNRKINSLSDLNKNLSNDIQKQNQQLRQTREMYLGSLNRIHCLKSEVQKLKDKLGKMQEIYNKYDETDQKLKQKQDMFNTNRSLILMTSNSPIEQSDLQHLLCDQQLNIQQSILYHNDKQNKQNTRQKLNNLSSLPIIQKLIHKGISYQQTKSIRNKQFQGLNSIIQRYRSESKYENVGKSQQQEIKDMKKPVKSYEISSIKSKQILTQSIQQRNKEIYLYR